MRGSFGVRPGFRGGSNEAGAPGETPKHRIAPLRTLCSRPFTDSTTSCEPDSHEAREAQKKGRELDSPRSGFRNRPTYRRRQGRFRPHPAPHNPGNSRHHRAHLQHTGFRPTNLDHDGHDHNGVHGPRYRHLRGDLAPRDRIRHGFVPGLLAAVPRASRRTASGHRRPRHDPAFGGLSVGAGGSRGVDALRPARTRSG